MPDFTIAPGAAKVFAAVRVRNLEAHPIRVRIEAVIEDEPAKDAIAPVRESALQPEGERVDS